MEVKNGGQKKVDEKAFKWEMFEEKDVSVLLFGTLVALLIHTKKI